jgi:hypothetical protein
MYYSMSIKTVILLIIMSVSTYGAELSQQFTHAIHMVETRGRVGAIVGDGGEALGPLQIHLSYWEAAKVSGAYTNCADLNYSIKVMTAYLNRYAPKSVQSNNYQVLARVHNGGPLGYKSPATLGYWKRVKKYLTAN